MADNYEIRFQKKDYESINAGNKTLDEIDEDSSKWNKFINGNDLKVWYRKRAGGGGMYDFYYEKNVEAPIENVVCVVREVQTFKSWVPMCFESKFNYETSDSQLQAEVKIKMPWPIKNRACYVSTNALIRDNAVDINLRSVHEEFYLENKNKIERDKKCEEVDCTCILFKVQRLS